MKKKVGIKVFKKWEKKEEKEVLKKEGGKKSNKHKNGNCLRTLTKEFELHCDQLHVFGELLHLLDP